jgi:hypothetical protein
MTDKTAEWNMVVTDLARLGLLSIDLLQLAKDVEEIKMITNDIDRRTLATSFRRIAHAASTINDVLHSNEALNNSVPSAQWPLPMSADEFAAECFAMAEYYEQKKSDQ